MNSNNYTEEQKSRLAMEILETIDDLKFAKDMKDFQEGRMDRSIRIPSRAQRKEMFAKHTVSDKISEWLAKHITAIAVSFGTFELTGGALDPIEKLQSQTIPYGQVNYEVSVFVQYGANEIEIYTNDESLIGKKVVINMNGRIMACPFEPDNTRKDMKAVAFFEIPKDIAEILSKDRKIDQIKDIAWEIKD